MRMGGWNKFGNMGRTLKFIYKGYNGYKRSWFVLCFGGIAKVQSDGHGFLLRKVHDLCRLVFRPCRFEDTFREGFNTHVFNISLSNLRH